MDVQSMRLDVIANNYANAEVPNFKRSNINFESELKKALASENKKPSLELARSNPMHFSNYDPVDYRNVRPQRVIDYLTTSKDNGNNVDPEQEQMAALKTQMLYNLFADAASFQFGQVNMVLQNS
jgi:flagellar basal-body rod protein FlgB